MKLDHDDRSAIREKLMLSTDAATQIHSLVAITREDIARAKSWIVRSPGTSTSQMVDEWIRQHGVTVIRRTRGDAYVDV
jgi:hypothetical protein